MTRIRMRIQEIALPLLYLSSAHYVGQTLRLAAVFDCSLVYRLPWIARAPGVQRRSGFLASSPGHGLIT
jgi:hypothetical protein